MAAACLAAGPEAVASHRAAIRLWGLGYANAPLELSVPYARFPKPRAVKMHRSTDLQLAHVTVRGRVPVTKPARTLVDLGAVAHFDVVADLVEAAIVRRLGTVTGLQTMVDEVAQKGRRGCGVLRAVLDQRQLGLIPPAARVADRQRQNEMAAAGYLFLRYGSTELRASPRRVLHEISSVVAERRRLLCSSEPV